MVKRLVLGVLLAALAVLAAVASAPDVADYSPSNRGWNGLSRLLEELRIMGLEVVVASAPLYTLTPSPGLAVILISPSGVEGAEVSWLNALMSAGGRVMLLEDFGEGGEILHRLGAPVRLAGAPVLDDVLYSKQPIFPVATSTGALPGFPAGSALILNVPSALELERGEGWETVVVAETSEYSFMDSNYNGVRDSGEPVGPFPVAVLARRRGEPGLLLVISDPSVLINCMLGEGDNARLLAAALEGVEVVVVDVYHRPRSTLEEARAALRVGFNALLSAFRDPLTGCALITLITVMVSVEAYKRGVRVWR